MITVAVDPALEFLTPEQVVAAGTTEAWIFVEAAPGSGKTTVAAQRFGAQRYRRAALPGGRSDHRGILAVSFTRSATWELNGRVRRSWGPSCLTRLHRIVTLDKLVCELLTGLLTRQLLHWPKGHTRLDVRDSWKVLVRHANTRVAVQLKLDGDKIGAEKLLLRDYKMRPEPRPWAEAVMAGICTHDDVRTLLDQALSRSDVRDAVVEHLATTTRALIVDEVFDANELDIRIIELAAEAGLDISLLGDPWQALYGFRGARPDLVSDLLARMAIRHLRLTKSFRWRSANQEAFANALRAGTGVAVEEVPAAGVVASGLDVFLACVWDDLWGAGPFVLPLAWGAARGNVVEAATTLLLNQVTRTLLGHEATYLGDALATLGITDELAVERLEPNLEVVLEMVAHATTTTNLNTAYDALISAVRQESPREFPPKAHGNYTKRLERLRSRLHLGRQVVPGMTVHQAKGREWGTVGLVLRDGEVDQLAAGLSPEDEKHRQLYVACTRARERTYRVVS